MPIVSTGVAKVILVTLVVVPVSAARVRLIVAPPAVKTAPVVPDTVKFEVSTAIPPSKLTKVVVVAPRPVTVARVEVLLTVTVSVAEVTTSVSVPSEKVRVSP